MTGDWRKRSEANRGVGSVGERVEGMAATTSPGSLCRLGLEAEAEEVSLPNQEKGSTREKVKEDDEESEIRFFARFLASCSFAIAPS